MSMGWSSRSEGQLPFRGASGHRLYGVVPLPCVFVTLALGLLAVSSCGGDSGTAPPTGSVTRKVTTLKFDRFVDSVEVLHTSTVAPVFVDQNGVSYNPAPVDPSTISWRIADTTVAIVSQQGVVTGRRLGATTLNASAAGLTASLPVVVTSPSIVKINYAVTSFMMMEGDTLTLPAPQLIDRTGAIATGRTPVFRSNSSVLSVSPAGLVTALTPGSGTITAMLDTAQTTLSFTIQAAQIASVKLVPSALFMGTGRTIATQASALSPDGGTLRGRQYTYSIDNPAVAIVSTHGIVEGVAPGKATLTVRTGTASLAVPISVATIGTGGFIIDLRFVGNVSSAVKQAATQAARRWETVISAPLIPYHVISSATDCGPGIPAVDTTETSMMIIIRSDSIDGRSNTVGLGGPCIIRDDAPQFTALGTITVDSADVSGLNQQGILVAMLTHEMGHVLGIGTLWSDGSVRDSVTYFPNTAAGLGGPDPVFIGRAARAASAELAFTADSSLGVPIENSGGDGTRDGHWRATVFGHELMTGTLHNGLNPLSLVTIEALADFGYTVVPEAADDLSAVNAASPSSPVQPSLSVNVPTGVAASPGVTIKEILLKPRFTVSRNGTLRRIGGSSGAAVPK